MVYRLKPLELSLDFEDRTYKLGDTISVRVELVPNRNVDVREVRVDLMLDERFSHTSGSSMEMPVYQSTPSIGGMSGMGGGGSASRQIGTTKLSVDAGKDRRTTRVHSSAAFLQDTRLTPGMPNVHDTRLEIDPTPPEHLDEAKALVSDAGSSWSFKWTLVATVDVVRGRNPKRQRVVKTALPELEERGQTPPRRRISRPKPPTGPSSAQ